MHQKIFPFMLLIFMSMQVYNGFTAMKSANSRGTEAPEQAGTMDHSHSYPGVLPVKFFLAGEASIYHGQQPFHHEKEDGKYHFFHLDRVKRVRRYCKLLCLLSKCFMTIAHICLLIYLFKAIIPHG